MFTLYLGLINMKMRFKVVFVIAVVPCLLLLIPLLKWHSSCLEPHGHLKDLLGWQSPKEKQHHPKYRWWNVSTTEVPIKKTLSPVTLSDEDYISPEVLRLSEQPDIDVRAKFQQGQIAKMCRHHLMQREQRLPVRNELKIYFRHFLFDDHCKAIFCFVPKIGCTNLKRLMLYMSGHLSLETVDWPWVDNEWYLEPALRHASLINKTLSLNSKLFRFSSYYKFMFVRNPLERLVSSYRNKIESPVLYAERTKFPEHLKVSILQRYRESELYSWRRANKEENNQQQVTNISVTFSEFVRNFVETDSMELNEHFRPAIDICHPCVSQFNFYGNFRNFSMDVQQLIHKFGTDPRFYRDESLHKSEEQTHRILEDYFGRLTYRDRLQLLGRLYDDLLFYYTLYPTQRHSHYKLLGIRQPIT